MIHKLAETPLPTVYGEFQLIAYDSGQPDYPHLALLKINSEEKEGVHVRIHSECMTGDVFSSVRCDCGEQLDASMRYFSEHGGILVYLRQEGRGIGLVNKIKAYNLQDQGMDTIKANHALGFHTDERDYSIAIDILKELRVSSINILTNNPEKIDAFLESDIKVLSRIPIEIEPRKENQSYLETKKTGMGHFIQGLDLN
jgi:GTP cyclohydrolase II